MVLVYCVWFIAAWFTLTYGELIYQLLGDSAESHFAKDWATGVAIEARAGTRSAVASPARASRAADVPPRGACAAERGAVAHRAAERGAERGAAHPDRAPGADRAPRVAGARAHPPPQPPQSGADALTRCHAMPPDAQECHLDHMSVQASVLSVQPARLRRRLWAHLGLKSRVERSG